MSTVTSRQLTGSSRAGRARGDRALCPCVACGSIASERCGPRFPPGRARLARVDELETTVRWLREFGGQSRCPAYRRRVRDAIGHRRRPRLALGGGSGVRRRARGSDADHRGCRTHRPRLHRSRPSSSRLRRSGDRCLRDALERGAEQVVLFTDLANPTANSIYQRIGYAPDRDFTVVHFTAGAEYMASSAQARACDHGRIAGRSSARV